MQEKEEEKTEINCKLYLFFSVSVQDLFQDKKKFFYFNSLLSLSLLYNLCYKKKTKIKN